MNLAGSIPARCRHSFPLAVTKFGGIMQTEFLRNLPVMRTNVPAVRSIFNGQKVCVTGVRCDFYVTDLYIIKLAEYVITFCGFSILRF